MATQHTPLRFGTTTPLLEAKYSICLGTLGAVGSAALSQNSVVDYKSLEYYSFPANKIFSS